MLALVSVVGAQTPGDTLVSRIEHDPSLLRNQHTLKNLRRCDAAGYQEIVATIANDPAQDWDLRARALSFVRNPLPAQVTERFSDDFPAVKVAESPTGPDAFNILGEWLRRSAEPPVGIVDLITPRRPDEGAAPLLTALAGNPVHPYLRWLDDSGFGLRDEEIEQLAATDDQLTRRLLCWIVGRDRRLELAPFLVSQIAADRPNTYRSQADRMLLAAFTVGIGELIRQAAPTPRWLEDDATPKGMALESLAILFPSDQALDPTLVGPLVRTAETNAAGKDKGQWLPAIHILDFLQERRVPLADLADATAESLVRQLLRKRGPLEAFIAAERLHRVAAVPFPELSREDKATIWAECYKTLNPAFLGAVVRALPDETQEQALKDHLFEQAEQAARGSLHVVRCWGADIEGPGDWALAVAELGINEAIPTIEKILTGSWNDEAAIALTRMGTAGARALARFLHTPEAHHLDRESRDEAVRACADELPEEEWHTLRDELARDPYLRKSIPSAERIPPFARDR